MRKPTHVPTLVALALAVAGLGVSLMAQAADHAGQQHPAVQQQGRPALLDSNRFIVAHPAGLQLRAGHANHAHPAVAAAADRAAGAATPVDANTFIVQPPASTRWTSAPTPVLAVAQGPLAAPATH